MARYLDDKANLKTCFICDRSDLKDDKDSRCFLINKKSNAKTKLFYAVESFFRINISVEKDSHVTCRKCRDWVFKSCKMREEIEINRTKFRKGIVVQVATTKKRPHEGEDEGTPLSKKSKVLAPEVNSEAKASSSSSSAKDPTQSSSSSSKLNYTIHDVNGVRSYKFLDSSLLYQDYSSGAIDEVCIDICDYLFFFQ